MQEPRKLRRRDVQGVARRAGDDPLAGGGRDVVAELARTRPGLAVAADPGSRSRGVRVSGFALRVPLEAADGVRDGPVTGAAAQVALEVPRQVGLLLVVEGGRRHHHAGGAEPALEALPFHELLLHRMQARAGGGAGQALHRGHGPAVGTDGRVDAAVHRGAVHVDGAGPAVAAVAALLDTEVALLPQERPQALARPRFGLRSGPVDFDGHAQAPSCCGEACGDVRRGGQKSPETWAAGVPAGAASSARISSASRYVMSLRQAGRPWMSSWYSASGMAASSASAEGGRRRRTAPRSAAAPGAWWRR